MIKKTRAKFTCNSVTDYGQTQEVKLTAVTGGGKENEKFWRYTPGGEIRLHIDNPEAAKMFKPGQEYYIDIAPAE